MNPIKYGMVLSLMLGLTIICGGDVLGEEGGLQSLRGTPSLSETGPSPDIKKQATEKRFGRAYRQQPPLIPHKIDKYQINLKVNQCMRCHDWPYNVEEGAPKLGGFVPSAMYRKRALGP